MTSYSISMILLPCSPDAAAARAFMVKLTQVYCIEQPVTKRLSCDTHAQCCKWSHLLHNQYLQNIGQEWEAVGQESLTVSILANLLFPYIPPLQGLSPHNPCAVHLPRYSLGELAQTLEPTFYTAVDATTNSYIPSAEQNPTPGITWNSCCSPCPHGARRAPH